MDRKRARAVADNHSDGHNAFRPQKHISPYDVLDTNKRAGKSPPQVARHADKVDDAAHPYPPRRGGAFSVLRLKHVPFPVQHLDKRLREQDAIGKRDSCTVQQVLYLFKCTLDRWHAVQGLDSWHSGQNNMNGQLLTTDSCRCAQPHDAVLIILGTIS